MSKVCGGCSRNLPAASFTKDRGRLSFYCRECAAIKRREAAERNGVKARFKRELKDGQLQCSACLKWLPIDAFYLSRTAKFGRLPECKNCRSAAYKRRARAAGVAPALRREVVEGRTFCPACREWLPLEQFGRDLSAAVGVRNWCLSCERKKRAARLADPDRARAYFTATIARKYCLSFEAWSKLLQAQQGRCAICRVPLTRGRLAAHIDHDHACCNKSGQSCGACVRGLLCGPCNLLVVHEERSDADARFAYRAKPPAGDLKMYRPRHLEAVAS